MRKFHFLKSFIFVEKLANKFRSGQNVHVKRLLKVRTIRHRTPNTQTKDKKASKNVQLFHELLEEENCLHGNVEVEGFKAFFQRGTRLNYIHDGSFQEAVAPVLIMAQFFCLMPVRGVRVKSKKKLSFRWRSFRTCYCLLYMFLIVIDMFFSINLIAHRELDVRNIEPVIFHLSNVFASFGFLRLAGKWPRLMRKWRRVENQMPKFNSWIERESLSRRIKLVALILIILSITEHLLSVISALHFANYCPQRSDPIESYLYSASDHIFFVIEYNKWIAIVGKIINVLLTFGWSYMDVFVSIMGIGLSALFERIQMSMERIKGQAMPEKYWTTTREQYRLICDLIEEVDKAISGIIMLSFANNLYFVCIQLLKSMNKMPSVAHAIYFYFSLSFLMARTLAVSIFLSEVHDRSQRPLLVLKFIPESAYYDDVERFARDITSDIVALTGLKFFRVTRKLVMTVAGAIITYELVLIQFHEDQRIWHCGGD